MNLKLHLLSRIATVALMCLLVVVVYVLYRSERQSVDLALRSLDSVTRQLEFQLLRSHAGYMSTDPFPDFDLWKQTNRSPGVCIRYLPADGGPVRGLCQGAEPVADREPPGFASLYRQLLRPVFEWRRPIAFKGRIHGELIVSASAEMAMARAWDNIRDLLGLSAITLVAIGLLVYLIVNRALRPAGLIVDGLKRMEQGDLDYRLPAFALGEWRQTAAAINRLAGHQQLLLGERQKLAVMLMNLQEDERRYLARELHDEFGQCLAAIGAVTAAMAQTAAQHCPALIEETGQISRYTQQMQNSVRSLLTRLRPAELDELGLAAGLRGLVARWNKLDAGKTRYRLTLDGDCARLAEPLTTTLFRLVQEGISNIARHASASQAGIVLIIDADTAVLTLQDDGVADALPFPASGGIGLLGMRERVLALDGTFNLAIAEPHGLIVNISLPLGLTGPAAS